MREKIRCHLAWLESLEKGQKLNDFGSLLPQIIESRKYFQHERLIHLIVTLGFGVFLMFALYLFIDQANMIYGALLLVISVLEIAYVVHYYHLENGVQRLWEIETRFYAKLHQG